MDAYQILNDLSERGILLIPDGEKLVAEPASRLSDADRAAVRQNKLDLLRILSRSKEASPPLRNPDALGWRQGVTPNSRYPTVPPSVRTLIEGIEGDARAKGWPPELFWNAEFWGSPRGLAAVLDSEDEIAEVTPDYIVILKTKRDLLRFRRTSG
jgi:hypothetical protein